MSVGQVELGPRETSPARLILNRISLLSTPSRLPYKGVAFCTSLVKLTYFAGHQDRKAAKWRASRPPAVRQGHLPVHQEAQGVPVRLPALHVRRGQPEALAQGAAWLARREAGAHRWPALQLPHPLSTTPASLGGRGGYLARCGCSCRGAAGGARGPVGSGGSGARACRAVRQHDGVAREARGCAAAVRPAELPRLLSNRHAVP